MAVEIILFQRLNPKFGRGISTMAKIGHAGSHFSANVGNCLLVSGAVDMSGIKYRWERFGALWVEKHEFFDDVAKVDEELSVFFLFPDSVEAPPWLGEFLVEGTHYRLLDVVR